MPRFRGTEPASQTVGLPYTWRVTTAIRVFAVALASGLAFTDNQFSVSGPLLAALVVIASASAAFDWSPASTKAPWIPLSEMLLSSIMLASADAPPALYAYLVAPPMVTGVRFGPIATINVAFVGGLGLIAATASNTSPDPRPQLIAATPWALSGLAAGLLASWQSRTVRVEDALRAPHEAAHQLMAQLHTLAQRGTVGLDAGQLAIDLEAELRERSGSTRGVVLSFADGVDPPTVLASHGMTTDLVALATHTQPRLSHPDIAVLPLRGNSQEFGVVALYRAQGWPRELRERARSMAAVHALSLETAALFDQVRLMATSEERDRIAREMHDGVAQEIVALGYVVDEIESETEDAHVRELATSLRTELSRVVTELRYSIYDLRQHVSDRRLSGALAEYVQETSSGADLRCHLSFDESGPPLSPRVETELLRIAQEAISNVRRHARADNLWVTFVTDGAQVDLTIEDDGLGNAGPKDRHWGLQTMTERAAVIGALLSIEERRAGGTRVHLQTKHPTPHERTSSP